MSSRWQGRKEAQPSISHWHVLTSFLLEDNTHLNYGEDMPGIRCCSEHIKDSAVLAKLDVQAKYDMGNDAKQALRAATADRKFCATRQDL